MRAALYARVSTVDKDQNPETQLRMLREHAEARKWTVTGEYVDHASAADLRGRTAWRQVWNDGVDRGRDARPRRRPLAYGPDARANAR